MAHAASNSNITALARLKSPTPNLSSFYRRSIPMATAYLAVSAFVTMPKGSDGPIAVWSAQPAMANGHHTVLLQPHHQPLAADLHTTIKAAGDKAEHKAKKSAKGKVNKKGKAHKSKKHDWDEVAEDALSWAGEQQGEEEQGGQQEQSSHGVMMQMLWQGETTDTDQDDDDDDVCGYITSGEGHVNNSAVSGALGYSPAQTGNDFIYSRRDQQQEIQPFPMQVPCTQDQGEGSGVRIFSVAQGFGAGTEGTGTGLPFSGQMPSMSELQGLAKLFGPVKKAYKKLKKLFK